MSTTNDMKALLNGPALTPPEGVEPNFNGSSNTFALYLGITVTCVVFATLAVGSRLYAKARVMKRLHLEDCKSVLISGYPFSSSFIRSLLSCVLDLIALGWVSFYVKSTELHS